MIPITYNYVCSCGYSHTQQENVQHGAYLRLLVDIVLLCPECMKRLYPTVNVTYASLQANQETLQSQYNSELSGFAGTTGGQA